MTAKKKAISDADEIMEALNILRENGGALKDIKDPVKWQRKQRKEWEKRLDFKLINLPK
jgi:hypothetical protein